MQLSGRYVVTGGGSGLGHGSSLALAAAGAEVVVMDRDGDTAARTAREVNGLAVAMDVSNPTEVRQAFETAGTIQGLVHCAGNAAIVPLLASSIEEWHAVISVQLDGTFLCLQAAARSMVRDRVRGTIVTVSSINASFAHRGFGAYCSSKAAMAMLTRVAALEFATAGIRVNSVAPGIVDTGMTRDAMADPSMVARWSASSTAGRIAQPADVADAILFLCSDESRWINGQNIAVDSGLGLRVEPKIHPDEAWSASALVAQAEGSRDGIFQVGQAQSEAQPQA